MTEEKSFITLVPGIVWMESDGKVWQCLDESFGLNVEKLLSENGFDKMSEHKIFGHDYQGPKFMPVIYK